jgi:filamentous hemagglutinin
MQLTGRRFLDNYESDEAQYQALMNNAVTYARAHDLRPGIALTAEQMAELTSDIVWLVEEEVNLDGGITQKVLVPRVYVRVRDGDIDGAGGLLAGANLSLDIRDTLINRGTLAGREVVTLAAHHLQNLGGRIIGNDVDVHARGNLDDIGGTIRAGSRLVATAGQDLNVVSDTRTQTSEQGSRTNIDRVAGLYVTGGTGRLVAAAGNDIHLVAARLLNAAPAGGEGTTLLVAGSNLHLGTAAEGHTQSLVWNGDNWRREASRTEVGTTVETLGDVRLVAGQDLTARAATVTTQQGALMASVGNHVNLTAGEESHSLTEAHKASYRSGLFAKTTVTTRDALDQTTAVATTLSGDTTVVKAGQDLTVRGSHVVSTQGTILSAGGDVHIEAATERATSSNFRHEKQSGLFSSGGIGFTLGTRKLSTDQASTRTTAAASTVGSVTGNVHIEAGQHTTQVGSDVLAPEGDIDLRAQSVDIIAARETSRTETETQFKQSGLTVALTSPVIRAIQTASQMKEAASHTRDSRMQALAAASAALSAKSAVDAVKAGQGTTINGKDHQIPTGKTNPDGSLQTRDANLADKVGGINVSISVGTSASQSNTVQTQTTAQGSTVVAGGNLNISARGAGSESDLTIRGSQLSAGRNLTLSAEDEIRLLAAQNTASQHSTHQSRSGSIGVSIGSGGFGVTLAASAGRGHADGVDLTHTHTHVTAGNQLTLRSGGDTLLQGAVAAGRQVTAQVGGHLNLESLQDTSTDQSQQQSIGGSITLGAGISGSVSVAKSNTTSQYASVVEQTGLQAGDGGFDVTVAGHTDLEGAVIASTQAAVAHDLNRFTSGSLSLSDIQNQASFSAQAVGVNLGSGVSLDGKLAPAGSSAGLSRDSGSAASVSRAGISGMAGNLKVRTGEVDTGIGKIFDADKVAREINAQVQITQTLGREASKAVEDYVQRERQALQARLKTATEEEKAALEAQLRELRTVEQAMNVLIGAVTGLGQSALAKEVLSAAAEEMRRIAIEDSKKFAGITDGKTTLTNLTDGLSEGVRGDGRKIGGTRADLDGLCGNANKRCERNEDGSLKLNENGQVQWNREGADGKSLAEFLVETPEGKKLAGLTGGIQGWKGTLFGIPYTAGSWQDKLIEAFAGTHDTIGGTLSGLYDGQGNIRRGMTTTEKFLHDRWSEVAIPISAPFALAELLPPQVWQAIAIFLKAAQ